jgi:Holliday junction resolvasome RuvABC endonuclease subunit
MSIYDIMKRPDVVRVMGADCSTQSFAFSIFDDGELVKYGEIQFTGKTVFSRLADGQRKVSALREQLDVDLVAIESAIYVQNKKTVILLAYAFGAIIAALINSGAEVKEVSPLSWQHYIGNKPLTKVEKASVMKDFPDKSKTWYTAKYREIRKDRTRQWVKGKFGRSIKSDNVTDAIALGYYASQETV